MKEKLLHFIDTTIRYDVDKLFARLPSDGNSYTLVTLYSMVDSVLDSV